MCDTGLIEKVDLAVISTLPHSLRSRGGGSTSISLDIMGDHVTSLRLRMTSLRTDPKR
jgi:hypothetical protein